MTIDELKNKHSIIEDITEVSDGDIDFKVEVLFILDSIKSFSGHIEDNWKEIDEYCTRVESIIRDLK